MVNSHLPVNLSCLATTTCSRIRIPSLLNLLQLDSIYDGTQLRSRALKKLRTPKGDYWIKQWFSSIASLFKMGIFLKGKNFQREQCLIVWKITFTILGDLP